MIKNTCSLLVHKGYRISDSERRENFFGGRYNNFLLFLFHLNLQKFDIKTIERYITREKRKWFHLYQREKRRQMLDEMQHTTLFGSKEPDLSMGVKMSGYQEFGISHFLSDRPFAKNTQEQKRCIIITQERYLKILIPHRIFKHESLRKVCKHSFHQVSGVKLFVIVSYKIDDQRQTVKEINNFQRQELSGQINSTVT